MNQTAGILKAAISADGREPNDFYPTPVEATRALIPFLSEFPRKVWEPACGDGAIGRELEAAGFNVVGTDLVDRGYGRGGVDFLSTTERVADALVTNPPFGRLASKFVTHALNLEIPFIAILFNTNFWHAKARTKMFERRLPYAILPLTWRLDFTGSNRPYFNCIWTVWHSKPAEHARYVRLLEPAPDLV